MFHVPVNAIGARGCVVECRTLSHVDRSSKPPTGTVVSKHGQFLHPSLSVIFGRDTKSRWSLLPGVYFRGRKTHHKGKLKKSTVDSLTLDKENSNKHKLDLTTHVELIRRCSGYLQ